MDAQSINDHILPLLSVVFSLLAMVFAALSFFRGISSKQYESMTRSLIKEIKALPRPDNLGRFDRTQKELAPILLAIDKLRAELQASQKIGPQAKLLPHEIPAQRSSKEMPEVGFLQELINSYNSSQPKDFIAKYSPSLAQFDGEDSLTLFDAGSFCIINAPNKEMYCVPRTSLITAILHQNVVLSRLFHYTGYDPNGPDCAFRLEQPAQVTASTDKSWRILNPGHLLIVSERA